MGIGKLIEMLAKNNEKRTDKDDYDLHNIQYQP